MRRLSSCLHRGRGRAIERGKRSESSRCRIERVKRRYRFLVQSRAPPFHRHGTDTMPDRQPPFVIPAKGKEERENPPATSNCKNLPRQQNAPSEFASVPFPREVPLGISPFLRRWTTDGIYHGGDLPEGSGDRQEAGLPRAVLSSFNPAAGISFGTSFFRHFFLFHFNDPYLLPSSRTIRRKGCRNRGRKRIVL